MRSPVNHVLPFVLIAAVAGGGAVAWARDRPAPPPVTGPAADYPVVIGAPFEVGGTTWTPEDRLNYDAVGYALVGAPEASGGGGKISAAHKTLPLPSYVEVTSLESGRTILVRVERRGPMDNGRLIELSPAAAAQLGLAGSARPAVRVRRVNPPEQERAMLRSGGRAPERMETPKGLLDALNRKLGAGPQVLSPRPDAAPRAAATTAAVRPTRSPRPMPAPRSTGEPAPAAVARSVPPSPPALRAPVAGGFVVQVAAFSNQGSATGVAGKLGGRVSAAGRVWRVRLGPFASQAQAQAALGKARAAGYSDARIQRAD